MTSENKKRHTVTLPILLIRRLRHYAFMDNVPTGQVVEKALEEYFEARRAEEDSCC